MRDGSPIMPADYTSSDPADRLAAVREAIAACLTAQEYGISARRKQMARLDQLRALEKDLVLEVQATSSGDNMGVLVEVTR